MAALYHARWAFLVVLIVLAVVFVAWGIRDRRGRSRL